MGRRVGVGGTEREKNEIRLDFLHPLLLRCIQLRMIKTAVHDRLSGSIGDPTRGVLTREKKSKGRRKTNHQVQQASI